MSVSLFRRWRSQKFSHLVGQESVVSTLQNVLKAGDPARAYLFCGPRGTGKTSSARIFAKALNCENGPTGEPCNECSQCRSIADGNNLDVFEIDAASHTQVDKIRDFIVEKVHFTPVSARYKVYIIDEVHKLSTSSFNALLKTLEEPPSHVVFILATTHPHEMPSTILSRCQRYDFRPLTASETEKHLLMIASQESIVLEEDAARQLARAADGSLRDALVLFEQAHVFADGNVTRDSVLDLLGGVGYEVMEDMFTDLAKGEAASALRRLDEWIVRGRDLKRLAESLQDHLRMMLLIKVRSEDQSIRHLSGEERASLDRLTQALSVGAITQWLRAVGEMLAQIRHGRRARLEWELLLVSLAHPETEPTLQGLERRLERVEGGVAPSASLAATTNGLDPALLARIEALEKAPAPSPVNPVIDPSLLERLQVVEKAASETSRIQELERQLARLSQEMDQIVERAVGAALQKPEAPQSKVSAPPSPNPGSAITPPAKPPELPRAQAPKETPLASPSTLTTDEVDQWLAMPQVLVTGRISRSGQTSLLDSMMPDLPEPNLVEPSAVEVSPPEIFEEAPLPEVRPLEPVEAPPVVMVTEPDLAVIESKPHAPEPEISPIEVAPATESLSSSVELPDPKEFFRLLMQGVKERDIRLHAVLADARLTELSESVFELAVPAGYDWHYGKIQEGRALLETIARGLVSQLSLQLQCSIGGEKATPPKENEHEELVKRASGVFGGSSIVD